MNPPKLPAVVVAVLGVLATVLTVVQNVLPSPWKEYAAVALAILSALGVVQVHAAVRRHGEAQRAARRAA